LLKASGFLFFVTCFFKSLYRKNKVIF